MILDKKNAALAESHSNFMKWRETADKLIAEMDYREKAESVTAHLQEQFDKAMRIHQEDMKALKEQDDELAALKSGKCQCRQIDMEEEFSLSQDQSHEMHCPEQASLLMKGYCDRIKELKLELQYAKLALRNLLGIIKDHDIPTNDSEDSCISCAEARVGQESGLE